MATTEKVLTLDRLVALRAEAARRGRAVVQCHGCFDIVHPGHIRHLRQARSYGDILLVTITGDGAFTKRNGTPLIPQELRAEALAELDCVDWVLIDNNPTAADLLEQVRPDVYVKGKEYEHNADARFAQERQTVEQHGGRVVFSSGDVVFSSTALIGQLEQSVDPYHARLRQLLGREELDGARLTSLISRFKGKRVLVVGETIIDQYVLCDQPEVASESPVMTLRPLERRSYDGGAAVIARHLAAMGAHPTLVTGLPHAAQSEALKRRLDAEGIDVLSVPIECQLPEKQRFLVGTQKVMKLNNLEPITLDAAVQDELIALAADAASGFDAAIIADFGNGLLSGYITERLCPLLRKRVNILAGDISGRRAGLRSLKEMDLLCPSESEVREAYRNFTDSIPAVAAQLIDDTGARAALLTMGADGLIAFEPLSAAPAPAAAGTDSAYATRLRSEHVPAMAGFAVDPLGCGDALLSAATLALTAGGGILEAAFLGSLSAAAEAQRLGNIPITATDLRHGIVRINTSRLIFDPQRPAASVSAAPRARIGL